MGTFLRLKHFLGKVEKAQKAFCMVCLSVIVVVLSLEILLRNLLGVNLQWAMDLSTLLMVWICFIGASMVYWRKGHIGIEALVSLFPKSVQKGVNLSTCLITGGGFVVLMIKTTSLMVVQHGQEIVSLGISRSLLSLPVVLGIGLMILVSGYLFLEEIFGSDGLEATSKEEGREDYDESY